MSETAVSEQPDLSSLAGSPGQKRKRELDSPGTQRNKRAAPPASMIVDTAAFIENAIEATHAAAAANGVNVADFNALQAAAADHPEATEAATNVANADNADGAADAADAANATSTAQAALGMYPTLHVPASTEEQFAAQTAGDGEQQQQQQQHQQQQQPQQHHHHHEATFHPEIPRPDMMDPSAVGQHSPNGLPPPPGHRYPTSSTTPNSNPKPTVGSEEWHKMRKDNHKEVERRRRETINEGINELAKIVPGCEKNKGSILQRACNFISQLKENEQQNIEKWTLEKLLTEQAITELSASNDKLKQECERLYRELETWKRVAQNAGLEPPQPKDEAAATTSN
ncbi:hypothetical protein E4U55_004158 [Claviceps digitariae]|nr:hypothetical protein E4U55_004158 [Claviceps digitariae]